MSTTILKPVRGSKRLRLAGLCATCALLCASCRAPSAHNYSFAPGVLELTGAGAEAHTAAAPRTTGNSVVAQPALHAEDSRLPVPSKPLAVNRNSR